METSSYHQITIITFKSNRKKSGNAEPTQNDLFIKSGSQSESQIHIEKSMLSSTETHN